MAPDLRRAETAGLARFTPLSKRLQMTNWVGCSTNRDVVPQSCTPTMDEQRRVWGWHWQQWRGGGGIQPPLVLRGPREVPLVCFFLPRGPHNLRFGCGDGAVLPRLWPLCRFSRGE